MSKKYIVFSDLHLTNNNSNFKIGKNGVSDLIKAQKNFVEDICQKYEDGDTDYDGMLFAGDWTDSSTIDPIVQTYSNKCLSMMDNLDGLTLAITGNHTVYDKDNVFTVFGAADSAFSEIDFVNNKKVVSDGSVNFYCVPYNGNYSKVENDIKEFSEDLDKDKFNILFFHLPLKGAELDNGFKSPDGVELVDKYFDKFDLCLGGDFHKRQNVMNDIYYIGAPFDLKFGENMNRGALELTIEDGEYDLSLIENDYQYNLKTLSGEEDVEDISDRDVIRFKGNFTASKKKELEELAKDNNCYSYSFSIANNQEDVSEVLEEFESLSGGDNYTVLKNYLNKQDVGDDFLDRCFKVMEKVV